MIINPNINVIFCKVIIFRLPIINMSATRNKIPKVAQENDNDNDNDIHNDNDEDVENTETDKNGFTANAITRLSRRASVDTMTASATAMIVDIGVDHLNKVVEKSYLYMLGRNGKILAQKDVHKALSYIGRPSAVTFSMGYRKTYDSDAKFIKALSDDKDGFSQQIKQQMIDAKFDKKHIDNVMVLIDNKDKKSNEDIVRTLCDTLNKEQKDFVPKTTRTVYETIATKTKCLVKAKSKSSRRSKPGNQAAREIKYYQQNFDRTLFPNAPIKKLIHKKLNEMATHDKGTTPQIAGPALTVLQFDLEHYLVSVIDSANIIATTHDKKRVSDKHISGAIKIRGKIF